VRPDKLVLKVGQVVYTFSCIPGTLCSIHACTKNWVFFVFCMDTLQGFGY
jgi:hypothetical protein